MTHQHTALHYAAQGGHADIIAELIRAGADVNKVKFYASLYPHITEPLCTYPLSAIT